MKQYLCLSKELWNPIHLSYWVLKSWLWSSGSFSTFQPTCLITNLNWSIVLIRSGQIPLDMILKVLQSNQHQCTGVIRDVNRAGRVRVVAPPYPTHWINICPVPVSISVGYPLCGYPPIFFIFAGIRGYPRIFTKLFKK